MAKGIDFFKIGQISGGAQPNIAGAIGKGLEMGLGVLQKLENDRKKADAEIAGVINTIGDDYDPSLFQVDSVRNTLTNVLQNSKIEAAKLIQERRELSPTDKRYTELTSQINTIRGSFDRLNKNALGYNDVAKQYAELRRTKQLSTAMDGQMVQDLDAILLKGQFNVKDDGKGNLTYIANGREYTQEQLDDFAMPNYNLATSYAGQIDGIEKYSQSTGKEIKEGDTQYSKLAIGLGNLLNNYTDQELKSAGIDGFINGQPLFLSTPEEKSTLLMLSGADLKAFVQGKLMDNYLNISSEAAKEYKPPTVSKEKPSKKQSAEETATDVFNMVIQDPVAYAKTKLRGNFKEGKGNIVTLIIDDKDKRFDLKRGDQFMEFMDIVTKNSNQLSGTAAGTQAAGREFYNLTLKARNMLNNREEGIQQMKKQLMPQFFAPETLSDLPTTFN
jgi:hypothetical protein